jgi:hypothetical protein
VREVGRPGQDDVPDQPGDGDLATGSAVTPQPGTSDGAA